MTLSPKAKRLRRATLKAVGLDLKPRRRKPRPKVTFTTTLTWTTAEARRFYNSYLKNLDLDRPHQDSPLWFPFSEFAEALEDETNFGDFLSNHDQIWNPVLLDYFDFVAEGM